MQSLGLPELRARRLIAQGLGGTQPHVPTGDLAATTKHMLATQGQNYAGGLTGLALRSGLKVRHTPTVRSELDATMDSLGIIRTWSQRGTLHFLHEEDFWIVQLCGIRATTLNLGSVAKRWDMPEQTYREIRSAVLDAAEVQISREQVRSIVDAHWGVQGAGVTSSVLRHLGSAGELVQMSKIGRHDSFIRTDQRVAQAHRRKLEDQGKEALIRELAQRYFSSRGPASVADLAWWSGLGKTALQKAAQSLVSSGELMSFEHKGTEMYAAAWQEEVTPKQLQAALRKRWHLPPFDEYLMAYTDRQAIFHKQARPHEVLTANGLSWEFAVRSGMITGRSEQASG
ncbi:winged helix DNA-binding domain-containing protein [Corynebacterium sp. 153RC1]|uniref:winged helix DNA-binding domain-containing protein n=1 Tax=unclassified Corynebacterium TaxID=2624378 RepID=UPI00211B931C|nr:MULTISPECIES: winged helix DNA-binding domain-containing protein [unclassified Corynebacterium]MCQ9352475.1 winged helix DNA-binding domain-containing protein [Corynebacterium sp. 209RC1]MCQ9354353.1 winged helix DNA-binding domain-containing protein [Corynebacterium sp. 1222RC1]MCQ9356758.1 winged helix DNA-binding domain-containing protein [Corynebacterium sp. 122RC1]MCQ9358748.1 winged helix DNA-binding domain-containing protein [Corynebacterium sp. 142RC1]MCQ9361146.1 winged helix DNA-b